MSGFIQSFSGLAMTPLHLQPEQIRFEDIPHALAQKTRFNGHLREFYSVAQHCVFGAEQIMEIGYPSGVLRTRLKLAFLLHEVSEVALPDVPSPIKPFLSVQYVRTEANAHASQKVITKTWVELEDEHANVFFKALGLEELLPLLDSPEVKAMDRAMLHTEKRDLRSIQETDPRVIEQERLRYSGEPVPGLKIDRCWTPVEAEQRFTQLYRELRAQLG